MATKTKNTAEMAEEKILEKAEIQTRDLIDKIACAKVEFELFKATIKNRREDEIIKSADILKKQNEVYKAVEDINFRLQKIEARIGLNQ
jgi:hypothetical protein